MFIYKDEENNDQLKKEYKEWNYILSYKDETNKVEKDNWRIYLRNSMNNFINNLDNQLDDVNINNEE